MFSGGELVLLSALFCTFVFRRADGQEWQDSMEAEAEEEEEEPIAEVRFYFPVPRGLAE